jgi:NAD(P)-dependent dehydrogenase (short-subunit alcohol dehydrogenase family)
MTKINSHFNNKVCWITGGGSGIGRAVALKLAYLGAKVFISGRNVLNLESVKKESPSIETLHLDVTDSESWSIATNKFSSQYGHLDLLFLNAGSCEFIDLPQFEPDTFTRVMDVNFMGIVKGIAAAMPLLQKSSKGHIAAVTSSVAPLPLPRAEAYGASKAAATYMLNSLRMDLAGSIDISVILPGFVETPMTGKNDFPMPFMVSVDKAAEIITHGLMKRKKDIYFPKRFTWPLRLIAMLPTTLRHHLTKRFR